MTNWQPIKTAPKDGTQILVWGELEKCEIVFWKPSTPKQKEFAETHGLRNIEGYWAYPGEDHFGTTRCEWWMSLPEPPKVKNKK